MTIAFRAETDLARWRESYARGAVPDELPYGLHKLERHGFAARWLSVPEATPAQKVALIARSRGSSLDADWSLAWDEYAAVRLLAVRPRARLATGVIWATDELGRSRASRVRSRSLLRSIRTAELVLVLSRAQVPALAAAWSGRAPRIEFVPFGIAADYFTAAPLPERPAVLSVGNDRDRDHATLLDALALVHRQRPDARIRVQLPGDTPLPDGVERLPRMSHDALREEYRDTTVLAVATRPNLHVSGMTAALEAMATGRPVAMTCTPGIDDYVRDRETGFLSEPGDSTALANSIITSLDTDTAREVGARGREAVERRHSTDLLAERLAAILAL